VLYARVGELLRIHVLNGDPRACHSFHLHGLHYGIDSDGAWPFGVHSSDMRRSDEIKPGQSWTYMFDATPDTVGAWAFHDHVRNVQQNVNLGLFGGLIVRDPKDHCADHEAPVFIHQLQALSTGMYLRSAEIQSGQTWPAPPAPGITFDQPGTFHYYCAIHGTGMAGQINILPKGPPAAPHTVTIKNFQFPPETVHVGDEVRWLNNDDVGHIVYSPGGGQATFCLNGRAYVGNTPTIEGVTGERIRWYVFNLDLNSIWHNFHPHSARWPGSGPSGAAADVHGLSPVESFVADTVVPSALRLPPSVEALQREPPPDACRVWLHGDFLFHCHIEEHMMQGLAGLVRACQPIWLTEKAQDDLDIALPYDDGRNECPHADLNRCPTPPAPSGGGAPQPMSGMPMPGSAPGAAPISLAKASTEGVWEVLPCDSEVLAVHGAVLRTGSVIFIAGSGNKDFNTSKGVYRALVWDYERGGRKELTTPTDVFCGGHAFLADGRLLVAGGTREPDFYRQAGETAAYLFDPDLEDFVRVADMESPLGGHPGGRWYPALIASQDGRILTASGRRGDADVAAKPVQTTQNETPEWYEESFGWSAWNRHHLLPLYPHLFLLKDGRLFYSGGHVFDSFGVQPGWLKPSTQTFTHMPAASIPGTFDLAHRDHAASVLLPPAQKQEVMIMGGGDPAIAAVHRVKLAGANSPYKAAKSMNVARFHLNAVLLPDRTVMVSGGNQSGEAVFTPALHAEIYHPDTDKWTLAAEATVPRLYHSIALLLPDGRVLTAGSNPENPGVMGGELRLELFHPPYLFRGPRPIVDEAPTEVRYGETFHIHTPQARSLKWVSLIRPMATTHSWESNQRLVDIPFETHGFCALHAHTPKEATIAPPGWYMLFLTDTDGVPSQAHWVHLS
jgi:plastocyanin